jgi:GNAT superfamily N-acetyltransferase
LIERPVITDEARFGDVDQIIDVVETVLGRHEVPAARAWLQQSLKIPGSWRVVRDHSASPGAVASIVSIAACLPTPIRLGSVSIPASRVDFVATRESHRGRGHASRLVRELLDDSDCRGDLVQLTDGIPYFYRQFGFGYALDPPGMVVLPQIGTEDSPVASLGKTGSLIIRPAVTADIERIDHYVTACMSGFDIAPGEFAWETWFEISEFGSDTDHLIVAESDGAIVGFTRAHRDGDDVLRIQSSYADSPGVARRIHTALAAIRSSGLLALDCGNSIWRDHLAAQAPVSPLPFGIYARTPDPVELLRLLRPEFDRRLSAVSAPEPDRKLRLSLFTSAIILEILGATIADAREALPTDDAASPADAAIAPEWFPALVLGRWGAEELARRVDDVIAETNTTTLNNLFPALNAHALVDL